jgi:hypothetical protein
MAVKGPDGYGNNLGPFDGRFRVTSHYTFCECEISGSILRGVKTRICLDMAAPEQVTPGT